MNTYICKCGLSLNIRLSSGKKYHVKFANMSDGRSSFNTDNEEIIKGMEKHHDFGKCFWLESSTKVVEEVADKEDAAKVEEDVKVIEVEVSCLADAKDYLAKNCGVLRSSMKTKASILKAAEENKIEFKGELS